MYCRTTAYKIIILLSLAIKKKIIKPSQTLRQLSRMYANIKRELLIASAAVRILQILFIVLQRTVDTNYLSLLRASTSNTDTQWDL